MRGRNDKWLEEKKTQGGKTTQRNLISRVVFYHKDWSRSSEWVDLSSRFERSTAILRGSVGLADGREIGKSVIAERKKAPTNTRWCTEEASTWWKRWVICFCLYAASYMRRGKILRILFEITACASYVRVYIVNRIIYIFT